MFPTDYDEIVRQFIETADHNFNLRFEEDYTEKDIENALSWYDDWQLDL